tara:strand:- start:37 stop:396 length:360 start_codon:yes stop_codon:yes gene_type:complete
MKSKYAFRKFEKYLKSMIGNDKFTKNPKHQQILYCKAEFVYTPELKKVTIDGLGDFDVEVNGVNPKDINFLTIDNVMNEYFITFYSFKGNPYGKDSPLIKEDGFIHAIPCGIELIDNNC